MPPFMLAAQSERDADNISGNTRRLVNLYPEPSGQRLMLKGVLGQEVFTDGGDLFVFAMHTVGDQMHAVIGDTVYLLGDNGFPYSRGVIERSDQISASDNDGKIVLTSAGNYYVRQGTGLVQPTAGAFDDFGSVEFLASYTILTERNGNRFQWSDPNAPETLPGLNFASAEKRDDDLLRAVAINGNLWLMGERSIEVWYPDPSGFGATAFRALAGGVVDTGLYGYNLVCKFDNGAFLVGDDGIAYITMGAGLKPVSIPAVETAIKAGEPSHCLYYEDEGHKFCAIRFLDRPAWVYDISTGQWHERATGRDGAWEATATAKRGREWFCGVDAGNVYKMVRNAKDVGFPLHRTITTATQDFDGERPVLAEFEIFGNVGIENVTTLVFDTVVEYEGITVTVLGEPVTATGSVAEAEEVVFRRPARIFLRMSKDGGRTWGAEKWRGLGAQGDYDIRAIWRALGQYRRATAEITITDPYDVVIYAQARARLA